MSELPLRPLGSTGLRVSPLGLGTVKIGRNRQVKYPQGFELPTDHQVVTLLECAQQLGINLIDTAPAYGLSEERLGQLLPGPREAWVIVSKAGESFEQGASCYDFSYAAIYRQVEQSLERLRTDYLDAVLIHSNGEDLRILEEEGAVAALRDLKQGGLVRAHGLSGKSLEGSQWAVRELDLVMVTCNPRYNEELPSLQLAQQLNKGVLIKKALDSGHVGEQAVAAALSHIYAQPGVSSIIVGTISPAHLQANAATAAACVAP